MGLASCHHFGAWKFEMAPTVLKNLYTPAIERFYLKNLYTPVIESF